MRVPLESTAFQQSMIAPIDAERAAKEEAEQTRASAQKAPEASTKDHGRSSTQTWAIGTLIGAGAFGATATIFWFVGENQYKELEETCAPGCTGAEVDDSGVKTSDLLTNVFLGLSAASLATSCVLFVVSSGESADGGGAAPQATLRLSPIGASISAASRVPAISLRLLVIQRDRVARRRGTTTTTATRRDRTDIARARAAPDRVEPAVGGNGGGSGERPARVEWAASRAAWRRLGWNERLGCTDGERHVRAVR